MLQRLEEEGNAGTPKRYHASNLLGILALNEDGDPARAIEHALLAPDLD